MKNRRALLIGATEYGEGLFSLPAVRNDLKVVSNALRACGYEIVTLPDEEIRNASILDKQLRKFCGECGAEDVHLIYFSGHGMIVEDRDCIIPAGASLRDAIESPVQRVSTDLSATVHANDRGLVVFIIDACRGETHETQTKAAGGWGDPSRLDLPTEHRFVRLFGCSSRQLCHVLAEDPVQEAASVFSKALAEVLSAYKATSLQEVLAAVQERCAELAKLHVIPLQTPRLSIGEMSAASNKLLNAPIFSASAKVAVPDLWQAFDPGKLHVLVIVSERETHSRPTWTLEDLVREATTAEFGIGIWNAFHKHTNGARLVSGDTRELPQAFSGKLLRRAAISINNAIASQETLAETVRCVIEADLAVFDVTGFEPGVMLLMGVRAACRRGITVCSHGNGWREGKPLEIPYNLQDLSISSHTPREPGTGENPVVVRFVQRVVTGFWQLWRQPQYLDLPAFDALRQLGSDYDACSTIPNTSQVLMLCPYEPTFFNHWEYTRSNLKSAFWDNHEISTNIMRVIDQGSPQLVSQLIYEQVRRTAACVVDWSGFSPSVFLELGVRLTVSEWGAVHIIVKPEWRSEYEREQRSSLAQVQSLQGLVTLLPYEYNGKPDVFKEIAASLVGRNPHLGATDDLSLIHSVAVRTIGRVQRVYPTVVEELSRAADALQHPDQERKAAPQILFYQLETLKINSQNAALERRIAAWLYLDRRIEAGNLKEGDARKTMYRDLGRAAATALYDRAEEGDIEFATYIEGRIGGSTP